MESTERRRGARAWAAALLIATACGPADPEGGSGSAELRDIVAVTSAPAAQLVRWVLPGAVQEAVLPAGVLPRDWSPDDAALDALVSARAVVTIGDVELEPWTQRVALPPSRTIQAASGLDEASIITVGTVKHTHGDGPAHSHGGTVATFWSDPELVPTLAASVADGLRRAGFEDARVPDGAAPWDDGLAELRAAVRELGEAAAGRAILASDHGLEYLARDAGVTLRVALLECGPKGPTSPKGLAQLSEFSGERDDAGLLVVFSDEEARAAAGAAAEFDRTLHVFDLGVRYDPAAECLPRLARSVRALSAALREL
ncbi:MAG: zinc ABC transporter substrate-binding protein [Planctomycetota bacterium]